MDGAIEVIVPSTGDFNSLPFTVPIICPAVIFSSNSTAVLNMPFSGEKIINGTAGTIVVCVETVGVIVPRTTDTVFSADVALSVRLFSSVCPIAEQADSVNTRNKIEHSSICFLSNFIIPPYAVSQKIRASILILLLYQNRSPYFLDCS